MKFSNQALFLLMLPASLSFAVESSSKMATHPPKPAATAAAKPVPSPSPSPKPEARSGFAKIIDGNGKRIGRALFNETREGVTVKVSVKGLKPGLHGIHIHELGRCEGEDFKSAGAHFNPGQAEHGLKNPHGAHAGDLPNLEVAKDGAAKDAEFRLEGVRLDSGRMGLFKEGGTAIVIHEKVDDQTTNPSGDSGDRIACGVIKPRGSIATPAPDASPTPAASASPHAAHGH